MRKKIMAFALAVVISLTAVGFSGCGNETTKGKYTIGICQLTQHAALDEATRGFRQALTEKLGDKVTFNEQNASGDSSQCITIVNQFTQSNVDLIMANATASLQAAVAATNTIPIVATSITDYATALGMTDWNGSTGINVTGTCDLAPLDQQAQIMAELYPAADNPKLGILYCSAEPNSLYQVNTITPEFERLGYTVKVYTFADTNDVSNVTNTACNESDVLYIPTDNTAASCTEAINNVATNAKTPIITGEEGICKGCGLATLSIDYYDIGYKAGMMAYEILVNGKDITTYEIGYSDTVTKKYNKANADALGATIPEGYEAIVVE